MNSLAAIPHQIPFRALSSFRREEGRVSGSAMWSAADALTGDGAVSGAMLIEAMAQIGGALVFSPSLQGALSGIDSATIAGPIAPGDSFRISVDLVAEFGRLFRMSGIAMRGEEEFARATFYLAAPEVEEHA